MLRHMPGLRPRTARPCRGGSPPVGIGGGGSAARRDRQLDRSDGAAADAKSKSPAVVTRKRPGHSQAVTALRFARLAYPPDRSGPPVAHRKLDAPAPPGPLNRDRPGAVLERV